jgi:hypothetical protein
MMLRTLIDLAKDIEIFGPYGLPILILVEFISNYAGN